MSYAKSYTYIQMYMSNLIGRAQTKKKAPLKTKMFNMARYKAENNSHLIPYPSSTHRLSASYKSLSCVPRSQSSLV